MCRKNHLLGGGGAAFGLGMLIGYLVNSGFVCICGGVSLILLGFVLRRQK